MFRTDIKNEKGELMSHTEHEPEVDDCGCPACDLTKIYLKKFEAYKTRKAYVAFKANSSSIEAELNMWQGRGYELSTFDKGIVIMRSVPPEAPTARDVLSEVLKRKKSTEIIGGDTIGETLPGMQ